MQHPLGQHLRAFVTMAEARDPWSELLARSAAADRLTASLVLCGNVGVGKRSLLRALAAERSGLGAAPAALHVNGCGPAGVGSTALPAAEGGSGLATSLPLHCWCVDDRASVAQLAGVLEAAAAHSAVLALCVDLASPWTALEQLRLWLAAIQAAGAKSSVGAWDAETAWRVGRRLAGGSAEEAPLSIAAAVAGVGEADAPLPAGACAHSAVLPLVVVGTRADCAGSRGAALPAGPLPPGVDAAAAGVDLSPRQLDVVVADLRRTALAWGAGVAVTSAARSSGTGGLLALLTTAAGVARGVAGGAAPPALALPTRLRAQVESPAALLLPVGSDSDALIRDSLLLHVGEGEDAAELTVETCMPEHGEEAAAAFTAAAQGASCGLRWRMFAARAAPPAAPEVPAALPPVAEWLGGLLAAHPQLQEAGNDDAATGAALGAMEASARKAAAEREAATEPAKPAAGRKAGKRSGTAGGEKAAPRRSSRRGKTAAEGEGEAAGGAAAGTNAKDFFASLLTADAKGKKGKGASGGRVTRSRAKASK